MDIKSDKIRRRYDRIAPLFDRMDQMVDESQREQLIRAAQGEVLEVGVGTGANLPYYSEGTHVVGIDFSPRMLSYASKRVHESQATIQLLQMDVQHLDFADNTFDTVVSTCVFCSVPNPIVGLQEIRRVLKPDGHLLMLEHMLSDHLPLAAMLHVMNPVVVRMTGANVNRRTMDNLSAAGFSIKDVKLVAFSDIFRRIDAVPRFE